MMRETRTLKSLFPDPKPPQRKNFIKENVKNLRKIEQHYHSNIKSAKNLKLPALRQSNTSLSRNNKMCDNQTASSNEGLQELTDEEIIKDGIANLMNQKSCHESHNRKKSAPVLLSKKSTSKKVTKSCVNVIKKNHCCRDQSNRKNKNCQQLKAHSVNNVHEKSCHEACKREVSKIQCKNQEVQTLDTSEINDLYSEGIIRYPSGRSKEKEKLISLEKGNDIEILKNDETHIKNHTEELDIDNGSCVKLSKDHVSLASKLTSQLNNVAPPPNYRIGVVPKYIKERKETLQKEQLAKTTVKNKDCPSGHVLLPDNERKKTLTMLKQNYQEYVRELNMLPIRTDTLRSQMRKMEIEKQLTKLEEAIKVFSRSKVFVKVDS